jgi:8-oxo-dGTP diphosphatase
MNSLVLRVAAKGVVINNKGEVLILREGDKYQEGTQKGKWGLPGGRLNPGEPYMDGLMREIKEETGLIIEPLYPVYVGEWRPLIKKVPHQIIAIFTACKIQENDVILSDEHDKFAWITKEKLSEYIMMQPDDEVIKTYYARV